MVRPLGLILSFGLFVLGVIGLYSHTQPSWFLILDFVAGGVALLAIIALWLGHGRRAGLVALALAVGLGVLWLVGLGTGAAGWLTWCMLGWGCAFLVVGVARLVAPRYGYRPLPDL